MGVHFSSVCQVLQATWCGAMGKDIAAKFKLILL